MSVSLVIDTVGPHCQVYAGTGCGDGASRAQSLSRGHAEIILDQIAAVISDLDMAYGDLDRILVTRGPGPFTGVRVGLSVARGLALVHATPVFGISSMAALALSAPATGEQQTPVHIVTPGRGGQVFYQAFRLDASGVMPRLLSPLQNIDRSNADTAIQEAPGLVLDADRDTALCPDLKALAALDALDAADCPPVPLYGRAADAAPAKPALAHLVP